MYDPKVMGKSEDGPAVGTLVDVEARAQDIGGSNAKVSADRARVKKNRSFQCGIFPGEVPQVVKKDSRSKGNPNVPEDPPLGGFGDL